MKMLCDMRMIDVKLVKCKSIVQVKVKILRQPFITGRYILEDYTYLKEMRSSLFKGM